MHKRAWAPRVFSDPVVRAQLSVVTSPGSRRGGLLGLFTGGTLAHEARLIAGNVGGSAAGTHRILDLGADEFTRGRPHPMICARAGADDAGRCAVSVASMLGQPLRVVNVGLGLFARELDSDGVVVVHVDWRPPSGAPNVAALLARLDDAS